MNNLIPVSLYSAPMVALYKLWEASMRYEVRGWKGVEQARAQGKKLVFAHFHDETFCLPYLRHMGDCRFVAIVSQSSDGEVMARLLQGLGLVTARGSKSRGGVKALITTRKMMLKENMIGVVTVDGPRGPRHKVKEGAVYLAHKCDALLVPIRIYIARKKIFKKAWDQFQLPFPGTHCRIIVGKPYGLEPGDLDDARLEEEQQKLEYQMLHLT